MKPFQPILPGPVSILFLLLLVFASACRPTSPGQIDPSVIPPMTDSAVNAVIEIPAGSNTRIGYDPVTGKYLPELENGAPRKIKFLPYPGNYGFIPGTRMPATVGSKGGAMDVLVLSESLSTGTLIRCIPIGALVLLDQGEEDIKIIAVPADPARRLFEAKNFLDLSLDFEPARRIIENWFLFYKGRGQVELVRWEDEQFALAEIRRWMVDGGR